MTTITPEQDMALERIFHRHRPLKSGKSAQEIARAAGWDFRFCQETGESFWFKDFTPSDVDFSTLVTFPDAMDVVRAYRLDEPMSLEDFKATAKQGFDCLMVEVSGMHIGIEPDGYSHT